MNELKITRCTGEGQGECARCKRLKGWNRVWMSMLYRIDGFDGVYCSLCVQEIKREFEQEGDNL